MKETEPADDYQRDLFTGANEKPADIVMAEQHVLRAARFAKMTEPQFLAECGQVFRALPELGPSHAQTASKIFALHQRYGREIVEVVNAELRENAQFPEAMSLPPTSLLAMINAPGGLVFQDAGVRTAEPAASIQAAAEPSSVKQRRLAIAVDEPNKTILLSEGLNLQRAGFQLVILLVQQLRADLAKGALPEFHDYVPTRTLVSKLRVTDQTLRQRVMRVRASLRDQYVTRTGYLLDDRDVIQNLKWDGYRLNPYLLLVDPAQLRSRQNVTTPEKDVTSL